MVRTLITITFVFLYFVSYAQNDCSDNLKRARQNFEDGIIEDVPSLLVPCLEDGFSKEEKISAYKLLVLTYLFDDNQAEAESAILNFFEDFPNYEIRTDDPTEFVYLLESYETVPVFSLFGSLGLNQSIMHIIEPSSTSPTPDKQKLKFGNTGFSLMLGGNYNLSEYVQNLNANIRLELSQYNFEFEETNRNTSRKMFSEKQTRINIPLFASYDLSDIVPELIASPEVYLGCNFEFITGVKGIPHIDYDTGSSTTGTEESIKSRRRIFEPSMLLGINYSYPVTKGFVFLDIHTNIRFSSQTNGQISNSDPLWSQFQYIDDKFSLHNIFFSIGYRYTFYKPIKIR